MSGSFTYLIHTASAHGWDPIRAFTHSGPANDGTQWAAVFGMLVYEDYSTGRVEPQMAESLVALDPAHWVLRLRPGVRFTDGTPYDAAAVRGNWERLADPVHDAPSRRIAAQITSLDVVDPLTLHVRLAEPNSSFDRHVAQGLAYVGSIDALRADPDRFRDEPVAAGPFVVRSHERLVRTVLDRNPSYWDRPRPHLDRLTFVNVADDVERYERFRAGEGQLARTHGNGTVIGRARADGQRLVTVGVQGATAALLFNSATPPFDDVVARRAVAHAIDVAAFNAALVPGLPEAVPTNLCDPSSPFHDARRGRLPRYDPQLASALAHEHRERHGRPLRFRLSGGAGSVERNQWLADALGAVDGIEAVADLRPGGRFDFAMIEGDFQVGTWPVAFGDPGVAFDNLWRTGGATNWGRYSDTHVDALLGRARSTTDPAVRAECYASVQERLIADAAFVALSRVPDVQVAVPGVRGLRHHVWGQTLFDSARLADEEMPEDPEDPHHGGGTP